MYSGWTAKSYNALLNAYGKDETEEWNGRTEPRGGGNLGGGGGGGDLTIEVVWIEEKLMRDIRMHRALMVASDPSAESINHWRKST